MCRNQDSRQDLYAIDRLFFLAGVEGHSRFASCLLDDPNALHFGTRLRTFLLKNSTPYCFFLRKNPLRVRVLSNQKRTTYPMDRLFFLAGVEGLEPSRTVLETGMLPLHHTPICDLYIIQ